jgi:putative membrane protein
VIAAAVREDWTGLPSVLIPAGIAAGFYLRGWLRLRRRGRRDLADGGRATLFGLGLLVAVAALGSPLDSLAVNRLLSAHMLQHVLIGDAAPALLLAGVRGPLFFFVIPAGILVPLAHTGWLRRLLSTVTRPTVAFALWATNLAVWHVPALYDAAIRNPAVHALEHACWFTAGLLVWTLLIDPAGRRRLSLAEKLGFCVVLFAAGQILTDVLVFSFTPLYPAYSGAYGLSALTDQRLAGVVMMAEQVLALGTLALLLLRPRLRTGRAELAVLV